MQDNTTANRVLGAAAAGAVGEIQVATAMVADNAVTFSKVADEGTLSQSAIKRSFHKAWILGK